MNFHFKVAIQLEITTSIFSGFNWSMCGDVLYSFILFDFIVIPNWFVLDVDDFRRGYC